MEVHVDLGVIRENARAVREMVAGEVTGVTKGVDANPAIAGAMIDAGIGRLAVSHPTHLERLAPLDAELVFVRIPGITELPAVVEHADLTLHGSLDIIDEAGAVATRQDRVHRIIPMVDAGDAREGIAPDRLAARLEALEELEGIAVEAIGINVGCFGELPDLEAIRRAVAHLPDRPLSVGGSVLLPVRDELPATVRSYRLGDAILTGKWLDRPLAGLTPGAFELRAEVIKAEGGESLTDVGSVSTDPAALRPLGRFGIERWSTELTVLDRELVPGDTVAFEMEYPAIARSFGWRHAEPIEIE